MEQSTPSGLYYVTRDASRAFLLDADETEVLRLSAEEFTVLVSQLELASEQVYRSRSSMFAADPSPNVEGGNAANALGVPHGVYYVTIAGDAMYDLTADARPDMSRREAAVAVALIRRIAGSLSISLP
ncbi:hypothetical protein I0C86_40560 [Plantactinospora sp. S1510]|uniref:Uncharacterized protein n=1 Tax=Plantactinospora alkalitolerans TaxID=2789879 RepID=A0ABS0HAH5_9ACTN|nr:hypothetical protein [Plantactinospora alkalitolerans]MBF9135174.1 hypothetical protein [Plantactinospora alkalitolerans]